MCTEQIITRPRLGPSLGFVTDVLVLSCVTYYGLFYCTIGFVLRIVAVNCTIGVVLRQCFSILFEFQVIRKGCEGSDAESLCDSDGNSNVKCGEVVSGKRCVPCLET